MVEGKSDSRTLVKNNDLSLSPLTILASIHITPNYNVQFVHDLLHTYNGFISHSHMSPSNIQVHTTQTSFNGQCNPGANISITPLQSILHDFVTLTIPFTLSGIAADGPLLHCIGQGNFFVPHNTTHWYPIQMFLCYSASETILSPQHACQTSAHLHGFKLDCTNMLVDLTFYNKTGIIILSIPLST